MHVAAGRQLIEGWVVLCDAGLVRNQIGIIRALERIGIIRALERL